jgi:hypothetical protein
VTILVVLLLSIWLLLAVARQLGGVSWRWSREFAHAIQRHDPLRLVPSFLFFAPNPPMFQFEVLYRDCFRNGTRTAWHALDAYSSNWWRAAWHPEKRRHQVIFRLCDALVQHAKEQIAGRREPEELYLSAAYVALACRVSAAPHAIMSDATQFLIAISPGFDAGKDPAIAFVSPTFRL